MSRHARAKHVEIGVRRFSGDQEHDEVVFSMADDGCGADLSAKHSGLGLLGMHERVELLGGRSRVVAAPGRGFRFLAHIPALDFVA